MAEARTINAWGCKEPGAALEKCTIEAPALGPRGIEIKVKVCGLCGSDIHLWKSDGGYTDFTAWTAGKCVQVCGHEAIGEVTAVGSAVTHLKLGDRAGVGWQSFACHNCEQCLRGDEQLCPKVQCTCCEGNVGAFADYIRLEDGNFVFPIPEALDSAATAPLLCGGVTVWTPLRQQTKAGDRVGILGLGGLGMMALQFARALGTEVTALSSSAKKAEDAMARGAHDFVVHTDPAAVEKAASSLDFILVTLATQDPVDVSRFFTMLRPRGTMCFVGMCPPITLDVFTIGFTMQKVTTSNTGGRKEVMEMLDFCARHKIGAPVTTRPMSEVNEAMKDLHENKFGGRYVLTND